MLSSTVTQLALELNIPSNVLLEQLRSAGVDVKSVNDSLTENDKSKLLGSLRSSYGESNNRKKITLTRRETSQIRQADSLGRSRTIQIEIRKKRTFVKRDFSEFQSKNIENIVDSAVPISEDFKTVNLQDHLEKSSQNQKKAEMLNLKQEKDNISDSESTDKKEESINMKVSNPIDSAKNNLEKSDFHSKTAISSFDEQENKSLNVKYSKSRDATQQQSKALMDMLNQPKKESTISKKEIVSKSLINKSPRKNNQDKIIEKKEEKRSSVVPKNIKIIEKHLLEIV
ncbi:MAG: translation initiation factor IF-2 associated domain-containing protein [Bordetella sp.]|nr:MAG: translation initiation factor IF-2 associated domain-containing protein [Bordetella sp.]